MNTELRRIFRGKPLYNEDYVYGYYFYDVYSKEHYILISVEDDEEPFMTKIKPNSVQQCTGVIDKNNNAIYEGMIVKQTSLTLGGNDIIGVVTYLEDSFYIVNDELEQISSLFSECEELEIIK